MYVLHFLVRMAIAFLNALVFAFQLEQKVAG